MNVIKQFLLYFDAITLIRLEWNTYNGFVFSILGLEFTGNEHGFEGELFGVHCSYKYLIIYLAFIQFEVKRPFI